MGSNKSQEAALYRLCHILAACKKLTSVSISGQSADYRITQLWNIMPGGLTTVKISDGYLDLGPHLRLDKLGELSINGRAMADFCWNATKLLDKVAAASFSES